MKDKFSAILKQVENTGHLPVTVLLKGKAGTRTISQTLKSLDLEHPIWQIHTLSPYFNRWKENHPNNTQTFVEIIKSKASSAKKHEKLKVISLVRDPIARSISKFFQQHKSPVNSKLTQGNITVDQLITEFFRRFHRPQCPFEWFDREISPLLGIDVFQEKFSTKNGYKIYSNDQVDLLIIRLENLNTCYKQAFEEFIGISNFQLINGNVGESRYYAEIYKDFKKKIIFPDWYLDEAYGSNRFKHFYTDEETKLFRNQWTKGK